MSTILRTVDLDGTIRLHLSGKIDRLEMTALHEYVIAELRVARDEDRPASFALDLEHAGYLDSRALRDLRDNTLRLVLSTPGTRFVIANTSHDVRAHLIGVGFGHCFEIADNSPRRKLPEVPV